MRQKLAPGKAEASDPALHIEMETLRQEREERLDAEEAQADKERRIAECHQFIGRIQASQMFSKLETVSELMWIHDVKKRQLYKNLPGLETWPKFCKSIGYTDRHVDDQLKNLEAFGAAFLETVSGLGVGFRELRQLRQLKYDGESFQMSEDGKTVVIEGEVIALGDDAAPEIEAALEKLLEKNKALRERNTKLERDLKGAVKEEMATFTAEKNALVERVKSLEQYEPQPMDETRFEEQYREIMEQMASLATKISRLMKMDNLAENPVLAARVEGYVASVGGLSDNLREEWSAQFQIY